MKSVVRVASGQGFWGDWLAAPRRQAEGGPIDYLMLDYLAEVTMSILQKQKERDPKMGYARDFVGAISHGRAPKSDLMLAHDVLVVTYAAYLSAEKGARIDIRPFLK